MGALIGESLDRIDARAKVTGRTKYTGDLEADDALHAAIVMSTACSGRVRRIDATAALPLPGVAGVMTHETAPRLDAAADCLTLLQDATTGRDSPVSAASARDQHADRPEAGSSLRPTKNHVSDCAPAGFARFE